MIFCLDKMLRGRRVVLASGSPRRRELMRLLFDDFTVRPASGEEIVPPGAAPGDVSRLLAVQKCREVAALYPDDLVIGCDTTVICGSEILGKPADAQDAARMLTMLSGSTHQVVSGVCIAFQGREQSFSVSTDVTFRRLSKAEIDAYIAHGKKKYPGRHITAMTVKTDGDFVDLKYEFEDVPFDRIRRITGYLVGTLDRFNNGKRAEEHDRVKHSI